MEKAPTKAIQVRSRDRKLFTGTFNKFRRYQKNCEMEQYAHICICANAFRIYPGVMRITDKVKFCKWERRHCHDHQTLKMAFPILSRYFRAESNFCVLSLIMSSVWKRVSTLYRSASSLSLLKWKATRIHNRLQDDKHSPETLKIKPNLYDNTAVIVHDVASIRSSHKQRFENGKDWNYYSRSARRTRTIR
ncbi:hypothetical protein TcasGA2_TC013851 [Tribolium castaneum]|uniref:Uncharacterized protein n=1 Tax=Tribolium castaneum TaxID=7070 RepID=D6WNQ9_TRICA|nr:hypothetical protein TcasGA2_TC013851 [Tribolium castaneum]